MRVFKAVWANVLCLCWSHPTDCLYYRRPHYAKSKRLIGCPETQRTTTVGRSSSKPFCGQQTLSTATTAFPFARIHWIIFVPLMLYIYIYMNEQHIFHTSSDRSYWQAQKPHHHHHRWKILTKHKYGVCSFVRSCGPATELPILGIEDAKIIALATQPANQHRTHMSSSFSANP